jgi:8-hydroxy-5-deazaflavin:NADPH oxidoreductase
MRAWRPPAPRAHGAAAAGLLTPGIAAGRRAIVAFTTTSGFARIREVFMAKRVAVLGTGAVGDTLAAGFLKHGYEVTRGSRDPEKLAGWKKEAGGRAATGTFPEAASAGDIVVLAVKGSAAEAVVRACGNALDGKTVIDTTNPIADEPPVNDVVKSFTGPNESLMERLQSMTPRARFVKCFSCVGNALMVNPKLKDGKPTMFLCGNDPAAKVEVHEILERFGWEWEDMGAAEAARAIEPLAVLWCIPGFKKNDWVHALAMLR